MLALCPLFYVRSGTSAGQLCAGCYGNSKVMDRQELVVMVAPEPHGAISSKLGTLTSFSQNSTLLDPSA